MRTPENKIGSLDPLFGKTKQSVLKLLFSNIDEEYHLREIARRTKVSQGALQRELVLLTKAGIVNQRRRGNQVFYQPNQDCPIFNELHSLVIKTVGLADKLREALMLLIDRIHIAFVFGSFADGNETAQSDIDLFLIGDLKMMDVIKAVRTFRNEVSREINPSIFTVEEYKNRLLQGNHFLNSLQNTPKIFIIGDENEFRNLGK